LKTGILTTKTTKSAKVFVEKNPAIALGEWFRNYRTKQFQNRKSEIRNPK